MSSDSFTVIDYDPDASRRPDSPCGREAVGKETFSVASLKTMLRQLRQNDQDITKEELQELCFYLGKKLLSRERAVITLNNRINNLQTTVGKLTRKK